MDYKLCMLSAVSILKSIQWHTKDKQYCIFLCKQYVYKYLLLMMDSEKSQMGNNLFFQREISVKFNKISELRRELKDLLKIYGAIKIYSPHMSEYDISRMLGVRVEEVKENFMQRI